MLNGRQFRTGVGQHSYAMFHDVTIAVIMRTANIIDSFYIAASSTLTGVLCGKQCYPNLWHQTSVWLSFVRWYSSLGCTQINFPLSLGSGYRYLSRVKARPTHVCLAEKRRTWLFGKMCRCWWQQRLALREQPLAQRYGWEEESDVVTEDVQQRQISK